MNQSSIALVLVSILLFIYSFIIEPGSLKVTSYQVTCPELRGVRVAFLSDLHLGKSHFKRLDKIIQTTNKQNPDIVLLGGDYVNGQNISKSMSPAIFATKLSLINAPTYAVLGEHDWWAGGKKIAEELKKNNIRILDNSRIRTSIRRKYVDIVGFADGTVKGVNASKAMQNSRPPIIVLTHSPDAYYDIIEEVTLILAGHTHGGQFVIPGIPPFFVPSRFGKEFASGFVKPRTNRMIISKGLGSPYLPLRLNCKPEIIIVDFVATGGL